LTQILVLIDYGSGNLRSAENAIVQASRDMPAVIRISSDPEDILKADRIVLPGVGAFGQCINALRAISGMESALEQRVRRDGRPFLGICVGMQLLATQGQEHGLHRGLGWIPGAVVPIRPADPALKIPHMGWNEVQIKRREAKNHPVLSPLPEKFYAYFVHSYRFQMQGEGPGILYADCDYGGAIASIVGIDTVIATQFHPEKSQAAGLRFLRSFMEWCP